MLPVVRAVKVVAKKKKKKRNRLGELTGENKPCCSTVTKLHDEKTSNSSNSWSEVCFH